MIDERRMHEVHFFQSSSLLPFPKRERRGAALGHRGGFRRRYHGRFRGNAPPGRIRTSLLLLLRNITLTHVPPSFFPEQIPPGKKLVIRRQTVFVLRDVYSGSVRQRGEGFFVDCLRIGLQLLKSVRPDEMRLQLGVYRELDIV